MCDGLDRFIEEVDREAFDPIGLQDLAGLAGGQVVGHVRDRPAVQLERLAVR